MSRLKRYLYRFYIRGIKAFLIKVSIELKLSSPIFFLIILSELKLNVTGLISVLKKPLKTLIRLYKAYNGALFKLLFRETIDKGAYKSLKNSFFNYN